MKQSENMILVLRRSNPSPNGDLLDNLVGEILSYGCQVQYVDAAQFQKTRTDIKLEAFFKLIRHKNIDLYLSKNSRNRVIKVVFLLANPKSILPFFKERRQRNRQNRRASNPDYVRYLIDQIDAEFVHLIAQSAGGITAALVSGHPKVKSLFCIGYPLKHPDKKPQNYRIKPLQSIKKPYLIIQGDNDEYGAISNFKNFKLSKNVEFLEIISDHSYKNISKYDVTKTYTAAVELINRENASLNPNN